MEVEISETPGGTRNAAAECFENGLPAAAVFVRNSGTEDKMVLYLRGSKELEVHLESLADKIYPFLLLSFKNKNSPMAQAEQLVFAQLERWSKTGNRFEF
jgi:hypothetical protein